jgi:hypothetical protein
MMATYASPDEESTPDDSSPSPGRPPGAVSNDISLMLNVLSRRPHERNFVLPALNETRFCSHDPIIDHLLSTRMTGAHDTFMIKTENNQWQDNIVKAIRTYITETIFKEDKSTDKAIQKMFSNHLHFGKTHDPNDAPLYTDAQLGLFIKRCDFVKIDARLIIWIRHTLVFPVTFPDTFDWTAVQPQEKVSPFRFLCAQRARRARLTASCASVPTSTATTEPTTTTTRISSRLGPSCVPDTG